MTLPPARVRRSPARSSIDPKGARSVPACSITGASSVKDPPADSGGGAAPFCSTRIDSAAEIVAEVCVAG